MVIKPGENAFPNLRRQVAAHTTGAYVDRGFLVAVVRVEMRNSMLAVVHGDDDSVEARNDWHVVGS